MFAKLPAALVIVALLFTLPRLADSVFDGHSPDPIRLTPGTAEIGVRATAERVAFWRERIETDSDHLNRVQAGIAILELARQSGDPGDIAEAIAIADEALEANPSSRDAKVLRAAALSSDHRFEEALAEIEPVVANNPNSFQAHAVAGDAHLELKNYDEAAFHLGRLSALQPNAPAVLSRLAEYAWDTDDAGAALDYGGRALTNANAAGLPPGELSFYAVRLARFRLDTGDIDESHQLALAALEIAPDVPSVHSTLGLIYQEQGRVDDAIKAFEDAVAITPLNEAVLALDELRAVAY